MAPRDICPQLWVTCPVLLTRYALLSLTSHLSFETELSHWILAGLKSPESAFPCHSLALAQVYTGTLSFMWIRGPDSGLHAWAASILPTESFPRPHYWVLRAPMHFELWRVGSCIGEGRTWLCCMEQDAVFRWQKGTSYIFLLTRSICLVIKFSKQFDTS